MDDGEIKRILGEGGGWESMMNYFCCIGGRIEGIFATLVDDVGCCDHGQVPVYCR